MNYLICKSTKAFTRSLSCCKMLTLIICWVVSSTGWAAPTPVTSTWLSRASVDPQTLDAELLVRSRTAARVGTTVRASLNEGASGPCGFCASQFFLSLETGENQSGLLRPNTDYGSTFAIADSLSGITDNNVLMARMDLNEVDSFLRESLGSGDHVVLELRIQMPGSLPLVEHGVNVANIDGELLVFDTQAIANLGSPPIPMGDFFANGVPGFYELAPGTGSVDIVFTARPGRSYTFPGGAFIGGGTPNASGQLTLVSPPSQTPVTSEELVQEIRRVNRRPRARGNCTIL